MKYEIHYSRGHQKKNLSWAHYLDWKESKKIITAENRKEALRKFHTLGLTPNIILDCFEIN